MAIIRNVDSRNKFNKSIEFAEKFADACMFISMLLSEEDHDILVQRFEDEVKDCNVYPWYKFVLDNVNVTLIKKEEHNE